MTAKTSRSLKNILIQPKLQLKLMSYFMGLFVLTTLTLYSTTFLFFWNLKDKALKVGIPEGHIFYTFLQNQKNGLDMLFLGLAGLNFILLLVVGFLISHRLAGPYYKIKNHLATIAQNSEDLHLREKDFFKDIEPLVNKLRDKIK
jgi:hypothetical protein